jgi:glycosyltransferase involved in cell wall biosynthesis
MLFYVSGDVDTAPSAVSKLQGMLSRYWDAPIRLFLCPSFELNGSTSKWQLYGAPALSFFRHPDYVQTSGPEQVQALERCLQGSPDVVFAHKLSSMCPLILTKMPLPPVLFDMDDIEHLVRWRGLMQQQEWRARLVHLVRLPALCWGERRGVRLSSRTFVCSEPDRQYLADRWSSPRIVAVPNAVQMPKLQPLTEDPSLLFIGSYLHQPNIDAAEFLIHRVWPQVQKEMPGARLIVAGTPPEKIRGYAQAPQGVTFTGFVDDVADLYLRSRVVCAPILSGGGTRVKIIEAASYGKPVVSTRIGAEGLKMRDEQELLLRDDAASFAQACLRLFKDLALCQRLGSAAREIATQSYDRNNIVALIQSYLKVECPV